MSDISANIRQWLPKIPPIGLSLLVGAVGGVIFYFLGIPLAWMLGAMVSCLVVSVGGAKLASPRPIRSPMAMILGLAIGSGFHPGMLNELNGWIFSLCLVVPVALVVTAIGTIYFHRVAQFDLRTAAFCALPGGLSEIVLIGEALDADPKRIALVHGSRIAVSIFVLSIAFAILFPSQTKPSMSSVEVEHTLAFGNLLVLLLAGVIGWALAKIIHMPAAPMMGPMVASAIVHISGLADGTMPFVAIIAAQIVFGANIGCQFSGVRFGEIIQAVKHGIAFVLLALIVCSGLAFSLASVTGQPVPTIVLAFAPAGASELSLLALSLGLSAPFVVSHHFVRQLSVILLAPLLNRILKRWV